MRAFIISVLASAAIGSVAAQDLVIEVSYSVKCDRSTKKGDNISVMYNGTLTDGTLFDTSELPTSPNDPLLSVTSLTTCGRL